MKTKLTGKVFIAVDVSGSALRVRTAQALKQAETIARALGATHAGYLAFDHRIESQERAKLGTVRVKELMKSGGGGTDYRPLFFRVSECPDPALLIVVTDMLGPFPDENPAKRATVIWINTDGALQGPPPFGLVVALPKED
jgi:predicted metal-dependent peptidase